jgi:hypothetical protein
MGGCKQWQAQVYVHEGGHEQGQAWIGFGTGNPQVGFSHTIPVPVDTVHVVGNTLHNLKFPWCLMKPVVQVTVVFYFQIIYINTKKKIKEGRGCRERGV